MPHVHVDMPRWLARFVVCVFMAGAFALAVLTVAVISLSLQVNRRNPTIDRIEANVHANAQAVGDAQAAAANLSESVADIRTVVRDTQALIIEVTTPSSETINTRAAVARALAAIDRIEQRLCGDDGCPPAGG